MKIITFNIDNRTIQASEGETIFQAAKANGIVIPHLCYDPRLEPFTSCWLCVVEIKGLPRLVPSCTAKPVEGMEVFTQTERVLSARRLCLELLLSDHYGDCIAPCQKACPDHIDIQGYLALIALGKYREALELIREVNPLPLCVGRVCPRFCEKDCRRNLVDEPVGINYLKRFVTESAYQGIDPSQGLPKGSGHCVAIVGAGPAGLSAAHFLRLGGNAVTIWEANPRPGGMMRYGIPGYRLPKDEMAKEIDLILGMGVNIQYNQRLGRDFTIQDLRSQGFSAVLLALGAWSERRLGCEGEDMEGVVSGIEFLYSIASGKEVRVGERVSIIGGGNTAIDAARSCLRMGAHEVCLIYRRSRQEMPALPEEVHEAELEGVRLHFLSAPIRIKGEGGRVASIECIRMELGQPDSSGRRAPVPIPGSEYELVTDMVIAAIGQFMGERKVLEEMGLGLTRQGIAVDEESLQTSQAGVFAAGDCVSGPATVIEAIAQGRRAAGSITHFIANINPNSKDNILEKRPNKKIEPFLYNHSKGSLETIDQAPFEAYEKLARAQMPVLSRQERLKGFHEVEKGLSEVEARKEARRCLSCGCEAVFDCKLREYATEYIIEEKEIPKGKQNRYLVREEHPFISRDRNKCIRCGLCVRICSVIEGVSAFGFVGRGFQSICDPPLEMTLQESSCDSCGLCLSTCPTGALEFRPGLEKPGPWLPKITESVCTLCGIGCQIMVKTRAGLCLEISPKIEGSLNQGKLCWKGAFGGEMIHSARRITCPNKKDGPGMIETGWDQALREAGQKVMEICQTYGPQGIGFIISPRLTRGEQLLLRGLADSLKIEDLCLPAYDLPMGSVKSLARKENTLSPDLSPYQALSQASYQGLMESDCLVLVGSLLAEGYPVISYMIKEAAQKGGELLIIGDEKRGLTDYATLWIDCPGKELGSVLSLFSAIALEEGLIPCAEHQNKPTIQYLNQEDREKIAGYIKKGKPSEAVGKLLNARRPIVVANARYVSKSALAWLYEGIWQAEGPDTQPLSLILLSRYGISPLKKLYPLNCLLKRIEKKEKKALIVFGHWRGLERIKEQHPEMVIIQSALFRPPAPYTPDILFPASLPLESKGDFMNAEGRLLRLAEASSAPGGLSNQDIILGLAKALGVALPAERSKDSQSPVYPISGKAGSGDRLSVEGSKDMDSGPDWSEDEIDLYLQEEIKARF